MLKSFRDQFNATFTVAKYEQFLARIEADFPGQLDFRIAETPIFLSNAVRDKLIQAGEDIVDTIVAPNFRQLTEGAIPPEQRVPNEDEIPSLLTFDFGLCLDENGEVTPYLIELQGFATLYAYQSYLADCYRDAFDCPSQVTNYFNGHTHETYLDHLRQLFIGDARPEETVLLEIYPEQQKTRIDFAVTERDLGIKTVCLTKVKRSGRELYYEKDGRKMPIRRIYNRVITDDLQQFPDLKTEFSLTDEVDVTWLAHPNWFYRISKYTLPLLQSPFVPDSHFLSDLSSYPEDLDQYVLKPLFSFAGMGVQLHPTVEMLDAIKDRSHYLLQRKVHYHPVIASPSGGVKAEVRLMYTWLPGQPRPQLVNNLGRMSRGEMIGVRYNKDFDWVGGTVCFFEPPV